MSRTVHRRIAAGLLGALAAVAVYQAATGCTTVIIPPESPADAVRICLIDHGHHAELVLPDGDGGSVAYVYGDWDYFALGKDDLWHGLLAVTIPTQGALGRRHAPGLEPAELASRWPPPAVIELRVSEGEVANLLEKLEARFNAGIETRTYNRDYGLEFVKDPATYIWFHNCNAVLADWLRELGCDCRGVAWYADFVVEQRSGA